MSTPEMPPTATILIVDDESWNSKLLEKMLQPEGYLTRTAANGKDALASIAEHAPDLILLDILMPGMDGYEVARTLKANPVTASIPIIMVTAQIDHNARVAGLNAGAEDFLTKPVDQAELCLRVRNLLRLKAYGDFLKNHNLILEQEVQARTTDLHLFHTAMDASADAIFLVNRSTMRIVQVNTTACTLLGYTREELLALDPWAVLSIPRAELERTYDTVITSGVPAKPIEMLWRRKDGSRVWVELRHHAQRLKDHWIIVKLVSDITERTQAEEALARESRRSAIFLRNASDGIHVLDADGNVLEVSDSFCKMLGYSREELLGANASMWDAQLSPQELKQKIAEQITKKGRSEFETKHRRRDGSLLEVEVSGQSLELDGKPVLFNSARDITERKADELALIRANRALRTLSGCNSALISAVSEPELLDTICRLIVNAGGYSMAWVGFAEESPKKRVRVVAQYGSTDDYLRSMNITWTDSEHGRGPTGRAIQAMKTQVHQSLMDESDKALWRDAALAHGFQSSIALPLKLPSGAAGALTLYARERDAFTEEEVRHLEELADDLAFGIATLRTRAERDQMEKAQLHHEEILRKSLEEFIQAIADTVEMRDPYTAGHQKRVAQLAVAIAGELGLPKNEIHGIHLAASIHDLGKIRVPAEMLSKPGKLTDIEYLLIKAHAQAGYDILKGIKFPWPLANIVLQHHERLDGSGYPQGLKGEQILLGARIIAVADVVEAMASHRPYRAALGMDIALGEIERGRGTAYDPAVANACLKLFHDGRFAFQG